MYIAEQLALITTEEDSGKQLIPATNADIVFGAALLLDLAGQDRVTVTGARNKAKAEVTDRQPTGSTPLDEALGHVKKDSQMSVSTALQ